MTDAFTGRSSHLQVNSPTFGRVDGDLLRRSFDATARRFRDRLLHLVDDLAAGSTSVAGFTESAIRLVRTEYGIAYSIGALSIDPFHILTLRDIRVINDEIANEKKFLRDFAKEIEAGFLVLDPVQRAGLYLQALRGMFELGRIEALPEGPYLWELGDTEHCAPCLDVSTGGPYQKTQYSGLGLPVLPGIPGSGEICRGLTRCGCTVQLENVPIPNTQLQQEIRDVLTEVLNDTS